jgi:hypothetical protein
VGALSIFCGNPSVSGTSSISTIIILGNALAIAFRQLHFLILQINSNVYRLHSLARTSFITLKYCTHGTRVLTNLVSLP